ncbi:keratin, type I cytoskeletal 12-like [Leptodactylus fuscus]
MSYRNANVQEAYGSAASNRAVRQPDNCDEDSQQMNSAGSHNEHRPGARVNFQRGGSGDYEEDSGPAHGNSNQSNMQRGYRSSDNGSSSTSRQRGGSDGYSSGNSSENVGGRYNGSSTGYTGGSMGHSGSYGSTSGGHVGGYRASSGGYASGPSGGYGGSSSGYGSGSSGHRVGFSGSSSSVSRTGGGNFSSRSTGGYSSRCSGRQGFGSGVSGNGGIGGFNGGSATGGQRGGFSTGSLGGFPSGGEGLLQAGEKETMQNLNSRLSVYMEQVRALEDSNSELEDKIRCWYETNKPKKVDNSKYYQTIEDIKDKIMSVTMDNNELTVDVDNAKLATDDFRVKYESELGMRQSVESDIEGLRKVLDNLTLDKASLESQIESLREEIAHNKKNHEQEMKGLQGHTSDVNVQVDAAPGINILKALNEMRAQYEELAEENRWKAEQEYNQKVTELSNEICNSSTEVETGKSEVTELKRCMQTMEIDLQSQLAMKSSLEKTLAETQGRYASQLAQIQERVSHLEEQLAQLRSDMENQACEHKLLLDIKCRLENEIEIYRRLLDGEGSKKKPTSDHNHRGESGWETSLNQNRQGRTEDVIKKETIAIFLLQENRFKHLQPLFSVHI